MRPQKMLLALTIVLIVIGVVMLLNYNLLNILVNAYLGPVTNRTYFETSQYSLSSVYTFLVLTNPVYPDARVVFTDYNVTYSPLANGSLEVKILRISSNVTQTAILAPGYSLYHIDLAKADDLYNEESTLTDDRFVVVGSQGYISKVFT